MEREVAKAVSRLFDDDVDFFGAGNLPALMNLVEYYSSEEDPDNMPSGKCKK